MWCCRFIGAMDPGPLERTPRPVLPSTLPPVECARICAGHRPGFARRSLVLAPNGADRVPTWSHSGGLGCGTWLRCSRPLSPFSCFYIVGSAPCIPSLLPLTGLRRLWPHISAAHCSSVASWAARVSTPSSPARAWPRLLASRALAAGASDVVVASCDVALGSFA